MSTPAKTVSIRWLTFRYLTVIVFLALAGVLIMALIGAYSSRDSLQRQESFALNILSHDIDKLLGFYRRIATTFAERQEVMDILVFDDVERAVAWAHEVRSFLPESIGVALIDHEGMVLGEPPQLNLGKQCVSDLHKMLSGEQISRPPIHRELDTRQHFDITVPVRSGEAVVGLLFMSFSLDILQHQLDEHLSDSQYLALVDGAGKIIAESGDPALREELATYPVSAIPATDWRMYLKGYDAGYESLYLLAIALGVMIFIVTMLLAFYGSSRLLRLFNGELYQIRNLLDSVHKGAEYETGGKTVQLRETTAIMEDVSFLVRAIEQANHRLKQQSTHDPLTGLYNRRAFDEELARHAGLAARGTSARLMLLDLDNFKPVNDRYGHAMGDEVLLVFSQTLHERCRSSDILARLGGDEFALIMPGEHGNIEIWFQDLLMLFTQKQQALNGGTGIEPLCSVSAGSILMDETTGTDVKRLMKQVDEKLYQAKAAGRGRVIH